MSGFQPSFPGGHVTQGVALGWDMAAPLALNVTGVDDVQKREVVGDCARDAPDIRKAI